MGYEMMNYLIEQLTDSLVGLGISGGPDSMALAFLFSQLRKEGLVPGLRVKGLIVDHKARSDSTSEAHQVASWLEDMGIAISST